MLTLPVSPVSYILSPAASAPLANALQRPPDYPRRVNLLISSKNALLDQVLKDYWPVFATWRLWIMDRSFPGLSRIMALLETADPGLGRHHTAPGRGFLPNGSYSALIIYAVDRGIKYCLLYLCSGREAL
jgi:hypothetical protein